MTEAQRGKRIRKLALIGAAVPAVYVSSYFTMGRHETGESWVPRYTYHDRDFPFDPWIYIPIAKIECKLRGPDVQVVLDGSPGRDGSAAYIFWSGEPKF